MTSNSTKAEFQRFIFEDPECSDPDLLHPSIHAAKNLGNLAYGNAVQETLQHLADGKLPMPGSTVGKVILAVLVVAERDPDWHRAIVRTYIADGERLGFRDAIERNAEMIARGYPLSPLDLMEFSND